MRFQPHPSKLFAMTLLIEFFISALARLVIYGALVTIPFAIFAYGYLFAESFFWHTVSQLLLILLAIGGVLVAYAPLALSIIAYKGYGGGHTLTRFALGARVPSRRENEQIREAREQVVGGSSVSRMRGFSGIYIVDTPSEYIYLIGTTLYISSGAIQSDHFVPMMAHEMGHTHYGDGALILALRRLVFPLFYIFIANVKDFSTSRPNARETITELPNVNIQMPDFASLENDPATIFFSMVNSFLFFTFSFVGGGIGVWLTSTMWARYFRERDYKADRFVANAGMKDQLLDYLEEKRFYDTSVPYMLAWQPANELRIDQLLADNFRRMR